MAGGLAGRMDVRVMGCQDGQGWGLDRFWEEACTRVRRAELGNARAGRARYRWDRAGQGMQIQQGAVPVIGCCGLLVRWVEKYTSG